MKYLYRFTFLLMLTNLVSSRNIGGVGNKSTDKVFVIAKTNEDEDCINVGELPGSQAENNEKINIKCKDIRHLNSVNKTMEVVNRQNWHAGAKSPKAKINSLRIQSDIRYRYSKTHVSSRIANWNDLQSEEITFKVILPKSAFISKFLIEIDGTVYESYVKEKEAARKDYVKAQRKGQSAGLVESSSRDSNEFNVNINVKAQSKLTFNLTYEELLQRKLGYYEQTIHIIPEQVSNVQDFQLIFNIEESQNITLLKVLNLQNDIEMIENSKENNKEAVIDRPSGNRANIKWSPSAKEQEDLSKKGSNGNFVIQYDINREGNSGEVLVMQGYFVHFFAPSNLKPLRKHVVFVLDISGSMAGRKLAQLKEAQKKILEDLSPDDCFSIITFHSDVSVWYPSEAIIYKNENLGILLATKMNIMKAKEFVDSLDDAGATNIHGALTTALDLIKRINEVRGKLRESFTRKNVSSVKITGDNKTTNFSSEVDSQNDISGTHIETLIIFLTDGEPTEGVTDLKQIQTSISEANKISSIPIFSLAFGVDADFDFLKKLSLKNHAIARKIYEASDAPLQLQGFYNEISSPLLSKVNFNYTSQDYDISEVTLTKFPNLFGGSEIAVAGKLTPVTNTENQSVFDEQKFLIIPYETLGSADNETAPWMESDKEINLKDKDKYCLGVSITGFGRDVKRNNRNRELFCESAPSKPNTSHFALPKSAASPTQEDQFLERLWAYLTIQQLLEKDLIEMEMQRTPNEETPKEKALRLALKYSFVTSLTSLVVVKPGAKLDVSESLLNEGESKSNGVVDPDEPPSYEAVDPDGLPNYDTVDPDEPPSYDPVVPAQRPSGYSFAALRIPLSRENEPLYISKDYTYSLTASHGNKQPQINSHFSANAQNSVKDVSNKTIENPNADYSDEDEDIQYDEYYNPIDKLPSLTQKPKDVDDYDALAKDRYNSTGQGKLIREVLQLESIQWYNDDNPNLVINGTSYKILKADETVSADRSLGSNCAIKSKLSGSCQHLKDCVNSDFITDVEYFKSSYFCTIKSRNWRRFYVGSCCSSVEN